MKLKAALTVAILVATSLSTPATADKKTAQDVLAGVALGVIGAAIAHHQHSNGDPSYTSHPHVSKHENNVGRCMHKTHNAMQNRGYHNTKMQYVVNHSSSDHENKYVLSVTTHAVGGDSTLYRNVTCVFSDGELTNFSIRNA